MGINQALCTSFKREILQAIHDFTADTGDTFKIALYTAEATLGASTTAYSATNEVSGTGYTSGGATLSSVSPAASGGMVYIDFANVEWPSSTITARGALIYNSSKANRAVMVLNFGLDKISSSSTFTVKFPTPNSTDAIIRI